MSSPSSSLKSPVITTLFLLFVTFILVCSSVEASEGKITNGVGNAIPITQYDSMEKVSSQAAPAGVKVSVSQHAFTYLLHQLLPQLKALLSDIHLDDIHTRVKTPIGHVDLSISSAVIQEASIQDAKLQITDQGLTAQVLNVHMGAHAKWHYREKSWPHVSDHGTVDLSVGLSSLDLKVSAALDPSHQSGIRVAVDSIALHFSSFHIKMHGGASWLYNLILGNMKHSIEHSVEKGVSQSLPPQITQQLQEMLDDQQLQVPISNGVFINFDPREVNFVNNQHITLGASGDFAKKGVPQFPSQPAQTPDVSNNKMVEIFLTDYLLSSAGWTFDKAGLMKTEIKQKDIPSSWPIQLNTSYVPFKLAIPGLYQKYPDRAMTIVFEADPSSTPKASMTEANGIVVSALGDGIFNVIQPDGSTVEAFTLNLELDLAIQGAVKDNVISGDVSLKNFTMSVSHSNVGDISVSGLESSISFLVKNIIVPIVNTFAEKGFPIPQLSEVTLVDPQLLVKDNYVTVYSDFTYNPKLGTPSN